MMKIQRWGYRTLSHSKTFYSVLVIIAIVSIYALQNYTVRTPLGSPLQTKLFITTGLHKERESTCQPKTHIFFLKTHKTASSTVMNILFRFGEYHNLTFALPKKQHAHFLYPAYFSSMYVEDFSNTSYKTFHIMCHHLRFQLSEVKKVMDNQTFYFTILRNPVALMESSFAYYKPVDAFAKADRLEDFIKNTSYFYKSTSENSNYAKNLMAFDLGFDHNGPESAKIFKLMQQEVETMFDLVLITEYFDESLVLLKDALCWTFEDVLSFPLNSRKNSTKTVLSRETQDMIKNWNQYDWQLYVYFNRSFWSRVETFGRQKMQQEVEELRRMRDQMSQICLQDEVDPDQMKDKSLVPFQAGIARIVGYNLNPNLNKTFQHLCERLVTPELQYSELLYTKQTNKTIIPKWKQQNKFNRGYFEKNSF